MSKQLGPAEVALLADCEHFNDRQSKVAACPCAKMFGSRNKRIAAHINSLKA